MQTINLGSVQSPYFEQSLTIPAKQSVIINYAYQSFQLLDASLQDTLEVTFGGAGIQSKYSAGMGYKLPEPVQYIQLFNTSENEQITIRFALAIGDISDNRLVVSGVVNTSTILKQATSVIWDNIDATSETTYDINDNSVVSVMVSSGTVTMNLSGNSGNGIILTSGQTVQFSTVNPQTLTLSGGVVNLQIEEY